MKLQLKIKALVALALVAASGQPELRFGLATGRPVSDGLRQAIWFQTPGTSVSPWIAPRLFAIRNGLYVAHQRHGFNAN